MTGKKNRSKDFNFVTVSALILSIVFWLVGGFVAAASGDMYAFIVMGLLATIAEVIAVNSARLEVQH